MIAKKYKLPLTSTRFPGQNAGKSRFFILKRAKNSQALSRWGVIISAKNARFAFQRNMIKRLFFEKVRQSALFLRPGYDYLAISLPSLKIAGKMDKIQKEEILDDLEKLLYSVDQ